jgi:putative peptidoglycan lipid II flippase
MIVKVIAMAKELAVARTFGRGDAVDAFLIAYMLPAFVVVLVAVTLNGALVPTLIQVKGRQGGSAAQRLFASAMVLSQALLIVLTIALAAAGPWIIRHIASRFPPVKLALTTHLFYALLPLVVLGGITSNCGAVLNACGHFVLPALLPLVTPALTLGLLSTPALHGHIAVLVGGALVGSAIESATIAWALRRHGFHLEFSWRGMTPELHQVCTQYIPLLVAGLLSSGVSIVDQSMAATLEPGSVAALAYGNRIVSVLAGLTAVSLSTAVIPYLSQMVADRDWPGCRRTLRTYTWLVSAIMVPLVLVTVFFSGTMVRLLYQRGAFTAADTALVSRVQSMYALQLSFAGIAVLYGRLLAAMRRTDLIMVGAAINLSLDIVLNIVCMRFLGVAGIALATSLFYAGSFVFVRTMALRLLHREEGLDWETGVACSRPENLCV